MTLSTMAFGIKALRIITQYVSDTQHNDLIIMTLRIMIHCTNDSVKALQINNTAHCINDA
jgi:hypothetical protein